MRAFLVDDEPLALRRLTRLLEATGRVEIAGSATDPEKAIEFLGANSVDVLFLDIQMPGMNGFEMLGRLPSAPWVVFTTAYDEYALQAFAVNSIDYLLKPVEAAQLERTLNKLERASQRLTPQQIRAVLEQWKPPQPEFPERIASRVGERVHFIDLGDRKSVV